MLNNKQVLRKIYEYITNITVKLFYDTFLGKLKHSKCQSKSIMACFSKDVYLLLIRPSPIFLLLTYAKLFALGHLVKTWSLPHRTVAAEVRKQIAGQYGSPQLLKNLNVGTASSNTVGQTCSFIHSIRKPSLKWCIEFIWFNTFSIQGYFYVLSFPLLKWLSVS